MELQYRVHCKASAVSLRAHLYVYSPRVSSRVLKDPLPDPLGDLIDRLSQLLGDGLPFESFDGVGIGSGRHDDESNNGHL